MLKLRLFCAAIGLIHAAAISKYEAVQLHSVCDIVEGCARRWMSNKLSSLRIVRSGLVRHIALTLHFNDQLDSKFQMVEDALNTLDSRQCTH